MLLEGNAAIRLLEMQRLQAFRPVIPIRRKSAMHAISR